MRVSNKTKKGKKKMRSESEDGEHIQTSERELIRLTHASETGLNSWFQTVHFIQLHSLNTWTQSISSSQRDAVIRDVYLLLSNNRQARPWTDRTPGDSSGFRCERSQRSQHEPRSTWRRAQQRLVEEKSKVTNYSYWKYWNQVNFGTFFCYLIVPQDIIHHAVTFKIII